MKLALGLVLALIIFTATTILYFTGPTTKTISERAWQEATCVRAHYEAEYRPYRPGSIGGPTGGHRMVCDQHANAGYTTDRDTVRTSAWERITGAVTGSGNVE